VRKPRHGGGRVADEENVEEGEWGEVGGVGNW
jgi:hypothetical protein